MHTCVGVCVQRHLCSGLEARKRGLEESGAVTPLRFGISLEDNWDRMWGVRTSTVDRHWASWQGRTQEAKARGIRTALHRPSPTEDSGCRKSPSSEPREPTGCPVCRRSSDPGPRGFWEHRTLGPGTLCPATPSPDSRRKEALCTRHVVGTCESLLPGNGGHTCESQVLPHLPRFQPCKQAFQGKPARAAIELFCPGKQRRESPLHFTWGGGKACCWAEPEL